jgi:hypothetical protein
MENHQNQKETDTLSSSIVITTNTTNNNDIPVKKIKEEQQKQQEAQEKEEEEKEKEEEEEEKRINTQKIKTEGKENLTSITNQSDKDSSSITTGRQESLKSKCLEFGVISSDILVDSTKFVQESTHQSSLLSSAGSMGSSKSYTNSIFDKIFNRKNRTKLKTVDAENHTTNQEANSSKTSETRILRPSPTRDKIKYRRNRTKTESLSDNTPKSTKDIRYSYQNQLTNRDTLNSDQFKEDNAHISDHEMADVSQEHDFIVFSFNKPTACDYCYQIMSGIRNKGLKCQSNWLNYN